MFYYNFNYHVSFYNHAENLRKDNFSTEFSLSKANSHIQELLENLDEKRKIIEKLKRIIFLEKNSLSIAKAKNDEMACLLGDQKVTIDSLMKLKHNTSASSRSQGARTSMDDLNALLTRRRGTGM